MPSRSNSALSSSSSERREPSLRSSVRLMFGAASFFFAFLPWVTGYPDQGRRFGGGSQQLNNHNNQLYTFFFLNSVTRFSFGGSCKQLIFEFLFLRQRPFMQTQSDCFVSDGFLSIWSKAGTPVLRENLYNNTVESPHPATLPSARLPPFSGAPLLWRRTLGAPGCRRRHKSYQHLQLMKRFCRGVKCVGEEEQSLGEERELGEKVNPDESAVRHFLQYINQERSTK